MKAEENLLLSEKQHQNNYKNTYEQHHCNHIQSYKLPADKNINWDVPI